MLATNEKIVLKENLYQPYSSFDQSFDLNNFVLQNLIKEDSFIKIYQIKEKKTCEILHAKIFFKNYFIPNAFSQISKLNHPSILKYYGYSSIDSENKPNPVLIIEPTSNLRLSDLILSENTNRNIKFNSTLKLITIFGIASAMSYLHANNIIHPDLKPLNVLFDHFFLPKIDNYIDFISQKENNSINNNSSLELSPEMIKTHELTKSSNVFSFGIITFEILTSEVMIDNSELYEKVKKGYRPDFKNILQSYRNMIEECWQPDPQKRPSFDEIIKKLKNDHGFTDEKVNKKDFLDYVNYIDACKDETDNYYYADKFIDFKSISYIEFIQSLSHLNYINITSNSNDVTSNSNDVTSSSNDVTSNSNDVTSSSNDVTSSSNDVTSSSNDKISVSKVKKIISPIRKSKFVNLDQFYLKDYIGEGKFGKVFLVREITTKELFVAKISKLHISNDFENDGNSLPFYREVKLMSAFNHPSIIRFVGYSPTDFVHKSFPTIITEYAPNGILESVIKLEAAGRSPEYWNDTRRLITIYGIASGMQYLHSHNVIHRDLKPANILIDEHFFPKIADFGLSKAILGKLENHSLNRMSEPGVKGTPLYISPEGLGQFIYSKPGDVFAFSIVLYELLTLKKIGEHLDFQDLFSSVVIKKQRPELTDDIPKPFQVLITKCWDQNPEKRLTFDEIVSDLKNNRDYLSEVINENDYFNYIDLIENSKTSFDLNKSIRFKDITNSIQRNKRNEDSSEFESESDDCEEEMSNIYQNFSNQKEDTNNNCLKVYSNENLCIQKKDFESTVDSSGVKIVEKEKIIETLKMKKDQLYAKELFISGKNLIERNDESQDIVGGIQLLEQSISNDCLDARIYYCRLLINGKLIPRNIEKAKELLLEKINTNDSNVMLLYGKVLLHEKEFNEAKKMIKRSVVKENIEAMFEYGKLLYSKNKEKAMKYFNFSKVAGFEKSLKFLDSYMKIVGIEGFDNLNDDIQLFLISQVMKNDFCKLNEIKIFIKLSKTKMFYLNDYFSSDLGKVLVHFKTTIQVIYPSEIFESIKSIFQESDAQVLLSVIFQSPMNIIADNAFKKCNVFFENEIPDTINEIGKYAFYECALSLSQIDVPPLITEIKDYAFSKCSPLEQIAIPSLVTSIGNHAFEKCTSLMKITIPSSVISIGECAFNNCSSLKQITVPSSVSSIGDHAFEKCSELDQIEIPSSVTSIGKNIFCDCCSLTKIAIPSSVISIGEYAFYGCSSLMQIIIPRIVTYIGKHAFEKCSKLDQIEISSSLSSIEDCLFKECPKLEQISIPSSITSIGEYAFYECSSLKQIIIPSSVTSIGDYAFERCTKLKIITINSLITSLGSYLFSGCISLTQITIPSSVTSIGNNAFGNCKSLKQVIIPSLVTSIGDYSFIGCSSIEQIEIPQSVTIIGKGSFSGCTSLIDLKIPPSVTSIENYTFYGCSSLKEIEIPSCVTLIGDNAFDRCSKLKQVTIPSLVESLGEYAFNECSVLEQITLPPSITSIGRRTFSGCRSLKEIDIPSNVTEIGNCAFNECSLLKQIVIPPSATLIGSETFAGCASLVTISIPSSVVSIGENAFERCFDLKGISIPHITVIKNGVFAKCSSLTQLTIPSTVVSIENEAFAGCSSLEQIEIPSSVVSIGWQAFEGCSKLREIYIPPILKIQMKAFSGCASLTHIKIPSSVTSIRGEAFSGCSLLTEIAIPSSVISIGNKVFERCSSLKHVEISSLISSIGDHLFSECSSLTSITIPSSVTSIGNHAFERTSIKHITIPHLVNSIGEFAFNECLSLEQITIISSATTIEKGAFAKCLLLKEISIPSSINSCVTEIKDYVFNGCSTLAQITIPSSVTSIGKYSFCGCSSLEQIIIPSHVTSIGEYAFSKCVKLKQIVIPSSVTSIGRGAFSGCSSLLKLEIPYSVVFIDEYLLNGCTSLTEITMPYSITSIKKYAFNGCSSIEQIKILPSVASIESYAFNKCSSLERINIPPSVTSIGNYIFNGCNSLKNVEKHSSLFIPERCPINEYITIKKKSTISSVSLKTDDVNKKLSEQVSGPSCSKKELDFHLNKKESNLLPRKTVKSTPKISSAKKDTRSSLTEERSKISSAKKDTRSSLSNERSKISSAKKDTRSSLSNERSKISSAKKETRSSLPIKISSPPTKKVMMAHSPLKKKRGTKSPDECTIIKPRVTENRPLSRELHKSSSFVSQVKSFSQIDQSSLLTKKTFQTPRKKSNI